FDQAEAMITDGYIATYKVSDQLAALSLSDNEYITYLESRNFLPREIPSRIQFVQFEGNNRTATERLNERAEAIMGQDFQASLVQDFVDQVVASESDIQNITYKVAESGSRRGILFKVQEKRWGPDYLRFGLKVADDFDSNTRI